MIKAMKLKHNKQYLENLCEKIEEISLKKLSVRQSGLHLIGWLREHIIKEHDFLIAATLFSEGAESCLKNRQDCMNKCHAYIRRHKII